MLYDLSTHTTSDHISAVCVVEPFDNHVYLAIGYKTGLFELASVGNSLLDTFYQHDFGDKITCICANTGLLSKNWTIGTEYGDIYIENSDLNVSSDKEFHKLSSTNCGEITSMDFNYDGTKLIVGSSGGHYMIFDIDYDDISNSSLIHNGVHPNEYSIIKVSINPNGIEFLVLTKYDCNIYDIVVNKKFASFSYVRDKYIDAEFVREDDINFVSIVHTSGYITLIDLYDKYNDYSVKPLLSALSRNLTKNCIVLKNGNILMHDSDNRVILVSLLNNINCRGFLLFDDRICTASDISKFAISKDGTAIIVYERSQLLIYQYVDIGKRIVKFVKSLFNR